MFFIFLRFDRLLELSKEAGFDLQVKHPLRVAVTERPGPTPAWRGAEQVFGDLEYPSHVV
jgi:hypothetical protein